MPGEVTWDSPAQYLKTVGPVRARALARLGIQTAGDLLCHYPRRYFDRSTTTRIGRLEPGQEATVKAVVLTAGERRIRRGGTIQTVALSDDTGVVFCVWFNQPYVLKQLRSGMQVMCSGSPQHHAGQIQLIHPDFEVLGGGHDQLHTGRLVPQYPLTRGLGQHWLRRLIHETLQAVLPRLEETLPAALLARRGLCGRQEALQGIHFPTSTSECERSHRRLVYEEVFLIQLTMGLRRHDRRRRPGIQLARPGDLTRRLVDALPFRLTGAQRRVLKDILADMRGGGVMHRLLQGDVGSGKTLVSLIAALLVIEQGYQAMIMAPTEVLAKQHGENLRRLVAPLGVTLGILTGATPAAERRAILTALGHEEIDLLVGTHAIIQKDVQVPNLALAVVDEQHRFGVIQRGRASQIGADGQPPHVLVMSATPIPRSLSLTLYGDLDLSLLDEMPSGRQPVTTRLVGADQEEAVHAEVLRHLDKGGQAYIIYPVIDETEGQDLKAATVEFERLAAGPFRARQVALLHGRQRPRQKETIMADFAAGRIEVLVATTVVEVGVDVANANIMVIHHPERFGLAQLHQLRGRIGRGTARAVCYLVMDPWLAPASRERLLYFASHTDGFQLAEEDLRRRGPGDVVGVRQHGLPGFNLANPLRDAALVKDCAADVEFWLARDPQLTSLEGRILRRAIEGPYGHLLPGLAAG